MYSAIEDLARRVFARAATVGIRPVGAAWESLAESDRDRWRAIAELLSAEDRFSGDVWILTKAVQVMSAQLDKLEASVRRNGDVIESAKSLIAGLSAELKAAKDDPAKLAQLADDLDAKTAALAAAVAENTVVPPA